MAGVFEFVKTAFSGKRKPEESARQKQLDDAIRKAEGEAGRTEKESPKEGSYESTEEGMRRKRITSTNPAGIQF